MFEICEKNSRPSGVIVAEILDQLKNKDGMTHFFFCEVVFNRGLSVLSEALDDMQEKGYEIVDVKIIPQGDMVTRGYVTIAYK